MKMLLNKKPITLTLLETILTTQFGKLRRLMFFEGDKDFGVSQDFIDGAFESSNLWFSHLKSQLNPKDLYKIEEKNGIRYIYYRGFEVEIKVDDYGMTDYIEFMDVTWCSNSYLDMTDMMDYYINTWLLDCSNDEFKNYCNQIGQKNKK